MKFLAYYFTEYSFLALRLYCQTVLPPLRTYLHRHIDLLLMQLAKVV